MCSALKFPKKGNNDYTNTYLSTYIITPRNYSSGFLLNRNWSNDFAKKMWMHELSVMGKQIKRIMHLLIKIDIFKFNLANFEMMLLLVDCPFRSYGSVFKALHKESGQVLAIKQVHAHSKL